MMSQDAAAAIKIARRLSGPDGLKASRSHPTSQIAEYPPHGRGQGATSWVPAAKCRAKERCAQLAAISDARGAH